MIARVAIVGLGPKGMYALERLLDRARGGPQMIVDVFEPHPAPGAGPNYDPAQPEYLVMNFAARHVDMWLPGSGVVPLGERRPFARWAECDPGAYVPRAYVGRYLVDGFHRLLRRAPENVRVTVHPHRVGEITPAGAGWRVGDTRYDEVLIATGHAPRREQPAVPAGARVSVRGFGLTFIDTAIALTQGRGGQFEPVENHPYRLAYIPTDDDVVLAPYSRTGRPMLPKPRVEFAGLESIMAGGRDRVLALEGDLVPLLAETAAAALVMVGGRSLKPVLGPAATIERSLAIGAGLCPPDPDWAAGYTWRALYPAIVERFSGDALEPATWPAFRNLAAEMERIAFGPAPENAAKLLALIEAGRVDLSCLHGGAPSGIESHCQVAPPDMPSGIESHRQVAFPAEPPIHLDAVLPGPEVLGPLLDGLVAAGHIETGAGRRGIAVSEALEAAPGLAVIGRPTEDSVIGNDTLSRTLHPHADRWAAGVAAAARRTRAVA